MEAVMTRKRKDFDVPSFDLPRFDLPSF